MNVGKPEIAALKPVSEPLVVNAEEIHVAMDILRDSLHSVSGRTLSAAG